MSKFPDTFMPFEQYDNANTFCSFTIDCTIRLEEADNYDSQLTVLVIFKKDVRNAIIKHNITFIKFSKKTENLSKLACFFIVGW